MRSLSSAVFFLLLSLLFLVAKSGDARKDPATAPADYLKNPAAADYWKSMMKGEPMPRAIEEILVHDHGAEISVSKQKDEEKKKKRWGPSKISMAHLKRDFDTTPNMIIYHSHLGHHDQTHEKSLVKGRAGVIKVSE
ncbi:hypothetical protein RHMOL_Rhmol05G0086600 [Rhododendron molle]|uniref:Uncharacterized protein n=1 Tax=Rhododendron molle TaxID=49168 RepID=A0ACC0NN24_RHOML|nr:hypothetical protein RHMOL_Rhmol05G0086600 [Rhododendron molle]